MCITPDLRNLRAFVAVAEELHFTRAAQRVHITQQALSLQIRQLEGSLGVPLFDRTTRRVELTTAGRTMLAHAVALLAAADRAWEDVQRVHKRRGRPGAALLLADRAPRAAAAAAGGVRRAPAGHRRQVV